MPDSREIWEAAVVGAILRGDGKRLGLCDIEATDFSNLLLRKIYIATLDLCENGEPIDEVSVYSKTGDKAAASAMIQCINAVPTHENLGFYIKNLKRHCFNEKKSAAQVEASAKIKTAENPLEVSDALAKNISTLEEKYSDTRTDEAQAFPKAVEKMMRKIYMAQPAEDVLFTGIGFIDRMAKGLMPADNIILAARPSQGKTALLMQILTSLSQAGVKSCFFSKEMTEDALSGRLLSFVSGRDATRAIREPDKLDAEDRDFFWSHRHAAGSIASSVLLYTHGIDMRFIRKKAKDAVASGAKIIALDYLQLMETKGRSRNEEIELISREWKNLLKELMVPGIMLSQLSRECERDNRRPRMSDLRDGGAIEQDADTVWFLHREKINPKDKRPDGPEQTVLIQDKGRNVGRGFSMLNFNGRSQTFCQIENQENMEP